jgi:hypothetical protein
MAVRRIVLTWAAGALCVAFDAGRATAQGRAVPAPPPYSDSVRAAPGPRYAAGAVHRFLFGSGWRDVWVIPITLPVLDLGAFAGGLQPESQGGNVQSKTLHFVDASGHGWVFRSVDKYPSEKIASVSGTPVGELIQDQISAQHPAAPLIVPKLLDAIGILSAEPRLYVMPDDARLGEFRATFAGMIGALEPKPKEGPDDTPGSYGSRKIVDTEELFDELEKSSANAVAGDELVRLRLLDFIIGDTDRTIDQYRFARFPDPGDESRYVWRPIPRDRDRAFMHPDGVVARLARAVVYPKLVAFGPRHSSINANTFSSHAVDRRLLTGVEREVFAEQAAFVKATLTDSAIAVAVSALPASYPEEHERWLEESIKSRRESLSSIADDFYLWLASEVDVRATDEQDSADIARLADGRVEVRLFRRAAAATPPADESLQSDGNTIAAAPYYQRVFLPSETREVRVFLQGGDDIASVHGAGADIGIRVIGGGGDDVLIDSSPTTGAHLYDDRGQNRFLPTTRTHVDTRPWEAPNPAEGARLNVAWAPDWGGAGGWSLGVDYNNAAGVIVGAGRSFTDYGFRRLPYHWHVQARALYGSDASAFGAELRAEYRLENSPNSVDALVRWSGFDGFRWYGAGNDTEEISRELSLVRTDRLSFEPSFTWRWSAAASKDDGQADSVAAKTKLALRPMEGTFALGPLLRYTATHEFSDDSPFAIDQPLGFDPLWQLGASARLHMETTDGRAAPRRGVRVSASALAFPGVIDAQRAAANASAEVNAYVPLIGDGLHLALRAGAAGAFGDYAAFDAAVIGGRTTLRGFRYQRFAGDAAAFGGAELRMPVTEIVFLMRGELGVFALTDAGRVWVDGESPGGWHTSLGGGFWFETVGRALSVAFASAERDRVYVSFGLPF